MGQSWTDLTSAGIKPRMELTDADRPHRWSERGTWRGFAAILTLTFTALGEHHCEVAADMEVRATGLLKPVGVVVNRLAPLAVRDDLKRAAKLLAS